MKQIAKSLHLNLLYISSGETDAFQPLDSCVFGAFKIMARTLFYQLYVVNPNMNFMLNEAGKILISCWSDLLDKALARAWEIYNDPNDDVYDRLVPTHTFV